MLGFDGFVQRGLLLLELHQPVGHGVAQDALLDDLQQVRRGLLDFPALGLQAVEVMRIAIIIAIVRSGVHRQRREVLGVLQQPPQQYRHQLLDLLLAHLPLVALLGTLRLAVVVIVFSPRLARAVHALHARAALAAEQLARQPVARSLGVVHPPCTLGTFAFIQREPRLHLVERLHVDQRRHPVRDHDVAMVILAYVGSILEHLVHGLDAELGASGRAQPLRVELVAYLLHGLAGRVLREHPLHERGRVLVHDVFLGFSIDAVAPHLVPVEQGVLGVVVHPPLYVLGELAAVILCHGVHQSLDEDSLGSLRRDVLRQQVYLASRVADFLLRHRQHVLVATQPVGLPHDESARTDFRDLRQHQLESRSVLLGAGYGRVLVLPHDGQPVGVRPRMGELPLLVDARLVLRMRRETIVRDGEVVVVPLEFLASSQLLATRLSLPNDLARPIVDDLLDVGQRNRLLAHVP